MNKLLLFIIILIGVTEKTIAQNSDTIFIEDVNVITMILEDILPNQRVIISDGKIIKIESRLLPFRNSQLKMIDGKNKYLIPGLSEMHYHPRSNDIKSDFKLLISNGITTVRNMAEFSGQDHVSIKAKVSTGELFGPNYYTTGPYLKSADLSTEEQVVTVVKMHKVKGYDFLKIADNLPMDIYLKLLSECQLNGIQIVGHAQRDMPVEYSLRMKSIEHIEEFLYLSDNHQAAKYFKQNKEELIKLAVQLSSSGI